MRTPMKINSFDIQEKCFSIRFRGLDFHEVDAFLEEINTGLKALEAESRTLHEDIGESKRQRIEVEDQIPSVLEIHAGLLNAAKTDTALLNAEEDKIRFLTNAQ